jgi:gliding motility-associated-like protein
MLKTPKNFLFFLGLLLCNTFLYSQMTRINNAVDAESTLSLQQLVENILISGDCAQVDTFSEQVSGLPNESTTKSYGYFKRTPGSTFPLEEGIVLTTGEAFQAGNTFITGGGGAYPSNANGEAGDADLENALGIANTNDATFIKFNFVPTSTEISFRYVMESEEYDGTTECNFADGFAFLLRQVGTIPYTNLAVLPDNTPVSVTNINNSVTCASNVAFFDTYNNPAVATYGTNYGGRTNVLTARATVIPNQTYEIKLVVADQGDSIFDSAIYLEAGSFELGANLGLPQISSANNAVCGNTVVLDANIVANSYKWYFDDGLGFNEILGETNQIYMATLGSLGNGIYKVDAIFSAGCIASDEVEIEFEIQATINNTIVNLQECDADSDGSEIFDLESKETEILNGQNPADFEVIFATNSDFAVVNQITPPTTTAYTSSGETIYVRVQNRNSTNCTAESSFLLEITPSAAIALPADIPRITICDNTSFGTDTDGMVEFDLTQREIVILNGALATDFSVTYFSDAAYGNQISIPTAYANTTANNQTIYVQLTNNSNADCFTRSNFEIEIFSLPVLNPLVGTPPYVLEQCDDDFDGFNAFNLTEVNTDVIAVITDETFTYYETEAEAIAAVIGTEITNPVAYTNTIVNSDDTLWIRVENTNACFRTAQIRLVVKPSAIPTNFLRTFSQCDDGVNTIDGIATFDISSVTADIQALFPITIDLVYYRNQSDATSETNAIVDPSNFENDIPNMQEIWVRADSQLGNDCLGNGHHVTLTVEALPIANMPTSPITECDGDAIPGDGIFSFPTVGIEAEILGTQSLADVTLTYYEEDGTLIGNSLPTLFTTETQTLRIVVTNNTTNDPDGACYAETSLEFVVQELPINNDVIIPELCDDNPDDGMSIATFDTSNLEVSIGAQAGMTVTYLDINDNPLQDNLGNLIVSPFPDSLTTETQTIKVVVTNPNFAACTIIKTIDFVVNPLPEFDLDLEIIVCENILPHEISVSNPDGVYSYEWFDNTATSIGTSQILQLNDTSNLTRDGVDYAVVVTNTTTGCSRTKTLLIKKSSIATITASDITVVEFNSPNNRIDILVENIGSGDYEYALDHATDSRDFQDKPIFIHLSGGLYTLRVRDKNGCGEATFDISLIDYPRFFTPNGDGINEFWQLNGVTNSVSIVSPIFIFDRYGKILAKIDAHGDGWDGLYNNKLTQDNDYWFSVNLIDRLGKQLNFKGHFSLIR